MISRDGDLRFLHTTTAAYAERSHTQNRSDPALPAQNAETAYDIGRTVLVYRATYSTVRSRTARRYMRAAAEIVKSQNSASAARLADSPRSGTRAPANEAMAE